ncbi:MAG: MarR family transcriptional regulator [Thermoleophilia bacterium]|nr:MarR family transcriptional regulator [Thermoleophilia bacterium]
MTSRQALPAGALTAWASYLRGHAALSRALNARLVAEHGLTLNDYEVLLLLSRAPDGYLKRVDLAQRVLLTPSGITRLLGGLESAGYVEKGSCPTDARVTYAVVTEVGLAKLAEATETHLADLEELFVTRFDESELALLAELLGRLAGDSEGEHCPGGARARNT